jgi:hypothetical protein
MKRLNVIALLFITLLSKGQSDIPTSTIKSYRRIAQLIKYDSIKKLATLVSYPLRRENPLPDIYSPKEFVSYYSTLFDNEFKQELMNFDSSKIFQHNGNYGLFAGDVWIDADGKIISINHVSESEKKYSIKLTNEIQSKMHPSIKPWKRNVLVCESKKYLVRIDDINGHDSLRYISWGEGKQISEKPDLILYGGTYQFQGEQGGITYTFKSGEWSYIIDEVDMCEHSEDCGLFFRILRNDKEVSSYRCVETK